MRFSPTYLADLKSRVDLPAFILQYVSDLKKTGPDTYSACCPFHEEKTPSFTVTERKGFYHCFGCPAHGDAITFLTEKLGKTFPEAVEEVAKFAGVPLPPKETPEKTDQQRDEAARFMRACAAMEEARSIYVNCLAESGDAQAYLGTRGISQDSVVRFGLGYAPNEYDTLTGRKSPQFTKLALEDSGLSNRSDRTKRLYDRFRDRIMFPIYGRKDRLIGFGGRAIHGQAPKYLNSPETLLFKKGENLYGLKQAYEAIQQAGRVFVFEGYIDVVMVSQHGVSNVVATLGTSITAEQMKRLFSLCSHVTFCMDGDSAGRKAAWRAADNILPLVDDKHQVDFIFMPDGMDPDDFVRANGKEGFERSAAESRTLTEYILDTFKQTTDVKNGESLARYLTDANAMANKVQNSVIRLSFQKQIAELAGISLDTMLKMLNEDKEKAIPHIAQPATDLPTAVSPQATPEISVAAKLLGIALLKEKHLASEIDPVHLAKFLSSPDKEMLFPLLAYIAANPAATDETLVSTMAFNPHAKLIKALLLSSKLADEWFDASAEIKSIIDGFKTMEHVWQIVNASKADSKATTLKDGA